MNRRDRVWILAFLVAGVAGVLTFLNLHDRAFPIASIDFKLSRGEVFDRARAYAQDRGHDLSAFEHAQTFSYDQAVQIFLQKTVGLETSNALARDWVSVWSWQIRWFKPLEKEEVHVHVDPGGRVVRYRHMILDTDEGANLSIEAAREIGHPFLTERVGLDLDAWYPIESSSEARKARTDHTFTLRKREWSVGDDGHYRMEVIVQGDRIGWYSEYLQVPESFERGYAEIRSRANLLARAFEIFWFALGAAVLVIVARRYRTGTLPWRNGGIVAIAVTTAMVVTAINSWPLIRYGYETTQAYATFMGLTILSAIVGAVIVGGIVGLAGAAGQAIGRETFGLGVMSSLSLRGFLAGRFATSTLIGYGLAGFNLGYVVLFYMVGNRFGVWSPAQLMDYSETFSTMFPWIYPLFIGLIASTNEEFFFRLVAISLLMRWTGRRWLSVLIPAIVWAFLHANYPQEPIYIRGIELTIGGCIAGIVFLRWGIWTVVTSHYAFNAFVGAYPMMNSSSSYFQISGIAVVGLLALPLIAAIYGWATGRVDTSEEEEAMVDRPRAAPQPIAFEGDGDEGPAAASWTLTSRQRRIAVGALVVGLAAIIALSPSKFGKDSFQMTVDRSAAFGIADSVRSVLGWQLPEPSTVTSYEDLLGQDDHTYLLRKRGVSKADSLIHATSHPRRWVVRWFAPLEKTEFSVGISMDGRVAFAERLLPESDPGATLSKEDAQLLASSFLLENAGVDVSDRSRYKLLESLEQKHESRLDHDIVWERTDLKVEDGEFWVRVGLQGDEVGSYDFGFTAPEPFLRALRERTLVDGVVTGLSIVVFLATIIIGGVHFLRLYRQEAIAWRTCYALGFVIAASRALDYLNGASVFYIDYDTEEALATFIGSEAVGFLISTAALSLFAVLLLGLANALTRDQLPDAARPGRWLAGLLSGDVRGARLLDGVLGGAGLHILLRGLSSISDYVDRTWFSEYANAAGFSPDGVDTYLPFVELISRVPDSIVVILVFACSILVWKRALKHWVRVGALALLVICLVEVGNAENVTQAISAVAMGVVQFLVLVRFCWVVLGSNFLAFAFAFTLGPLVDAGLHLMRTDLVFYDVNGALVLMLAAVPIAVGLWQRNRDGETVEQRTEVRGQ